MSTAIVGWNSAAGKYIEIASDENGALLTTSAGGGASSQIDFELLIVQDSTTPTPVVGIRRESENDDGTFTITFENFDGSEWTPVAPLFLVAPALPPNAATEASLALVKGGIGAIADTAATSGTGSFNLIQLLKRFVGAIANTASAIPTPVLMVGGSDGMNARNLHTDIKGRLYTAGIMALVWAQDIVTATPGTAVSSANFQSGTLALSLYCDVGPIRYSLSGAATNTSGANTSHYLGQGERVDIQTNGATSVSINTLTGASSNVSVHLTELG